MKKFLRKLLLFIIFLIIVISSIACLVGYSYYRKALKTKPLLERIDEVTSKQNYTIFSKLPQNYVNAVIDIEDKRFYNHGAVDFISIARAFYINIREGDFDEGGSTITQQVAKNIVFSQDKNIVRKLGEIFAAHDLEKNYTKDEILSLYVNSVYFGDGYYGIYDASHGYYNKDPQDLNLDEASMLAGIPNAPSVYSPTINPELASQRQKQVLDAMVDCGDITQEQENSVK